MAKYIDADALLAQMKDRRFYVGRRSDPVCVVEDAPAADVISVVRCKDCKYKPTAPGGITHGLQVEFPDKWANRCPCLCEDGWYSWVPEGDFFCAYGAKMEGEADDGHMDV